MEVSLDKKVLERMSSKSVENSIINDIAQDFNLTPILAKAYFDQIKNYFDEHTGFELSSGQIHYLAIDDREPAGKPVALCKKVSVFLTVHDPNEDLEVYRKSGLSGLRQHRLQRITKEAIEQGALLSYEDVAFILTTSVVTIKRDMARLRRQGLTIPSRGWRHDMGRGTTHKTQILDMYFAGYQFSEIEKRTHHSETAVTRYIRDFAKIVLLHTKAFSVDQIRVTTGFSNRLIGEYIKLYKNYHKEQNNRLKSILQTAKKNQQNQQSETMES